MFITGKALNRHFNHRYTQMDANRHKPAAHAGKNSGYELKDNKASLKKVKAVAIVSKHSEDAVPMVVRVSKSHRSDWTSCLEWSSTVSRLQWS